MMSSNEDCKLNSPKDWERWNRQFKSTAVAADLWDVLQGLESPIQKPLKPDINSFPRTTPPISTRSQSQAASGQATDDSQGTVQQEEPAQVQAQYADLTSAGQNAFKAALTIYEND